MNILIIGNGGREHALAWKAAQSPLATHVFVAPGNAGTALEPNMKNVDIAATDLSALLEFAKTTPIDLTIVGPEAPLSLGIVDLFQKHSLKIFGPTQFCAQLESSKAFSKDFMQAHGIPTAFYKTFTDLDAAKQFIRQQGAPIVVKADGLAAGKGVVVALTEAEAIAAVEDMLGGNRFGAAGHRVVIEEFLSGVEASFIVMCDGSHALAMATSQDHKRRDDSDRGPNTGGMGAYSPAPVVTTAIHDKVMQQVIQPVLNGMAKLAHPYSGFLYAGLMIAPNGDIKVLEFNCRFGDPETQPIMLRLKSDLVAHCLAAVDKKLNQEQTSWDPRPAVGVVMASQGYPDNYPKGDIVEGLRDKDTLDAKIFHAGTILRDYNVITNGGRVLCVTALGANIKLAQQGAYQVVKQIHWGNEFYRHDIAYRAI